MTEDHHQQLLRHPEAGALALNRSSSLVRWGLAALATLERTIRFPNHRQVGWLHFDGQRVAAKGEVRVPRACTVELQVSIEGVRDLAFFGELGVENIQSLDLWSAGGYLRDRDLANLEALPGLTALDLSWCKNLTDAGLAQFRPLHGLVELTLPSSITNDACNAFYGPG